MEGCDLSVFYALQQWQPGGLPLWLLTVADTFGSSPRPPGSMIALRADGRYAGSVSGGCVEEDLVFRAREGRLARGCCEIIEYGVTREEAGRFGLPCGGVMRLVAEPVRGEWVNDALSLIRKRKIVRRTLHLASSKVALSEDEGGEDVFFDGKTLVCLHGPRWRLLLIGAGEVSAYLARMALALDYQVLVCDPRQDLRQSWEVEGVTLLADMPDDAVLGQETDARTAIIALTHDPKLDDMALLEALKSPAFYVGALGSHANSERRRERLSLFDLSEAEIGKLHAPVGIRIGSRTPPEIAVSILADLISARSASRKAQS